MTKMLASVTGPDEAETALGGGADLIDLKDPRDGALGAVAPDVLAATIRRIAGRRPVSAVAGNLPMEPAAVRAAAAERAGADFVKVGLFPAPIEARRAVVAGLKSLAAETRLIAVFFADGDPDLTLIDDLRAAGFAGAMVDTLDKSGGGLLKHLPVARLGDFVAACRAHGLLSGLAGSLEAPDVPRLLVLEPDYLGFRRALTAGDRDGPIDGAAVAVIRALIGAPAPGPVTNERTDRIFVRDFTLDMAVGAYGFEHGRTQKVRFSVEADVRRLARPASGMNGVYSYDLITDAVRTLAARGHTDFVETLAEDLAETLLRDRRVAGVTVKVEKLELGPAAVGVEIRRP